MDDTICNSKVNQRTPTIFDPEFDKCYRLIFTNNKRQVYDDVHPFAFGSPFPLLGEKFHDLEGNEWTLRYAEEVPASELTLY